MTEPSDTEGTVPPPADGDYGPGARRTAIGALVLFVLTAVAEWAAAEHAAHVPFQASLLLFVPAIAVVYGVAAGFLCRNIQEAIVFAVLPALTRGFGVAMAVESSMDGDAALLPMIAILGVPGWLLAVAAVAATYGVRAALRQSHGPPSRR